MKGPSLGRRLLLFAGYAAFFLFAFVLFVYLTLPLDTVRSYLVRKAADEYGADLTIADLSTWGLSGVHAEGVSVTFRPTPEEEAAMEAAREARKAWEAAHGGPAKAGKSETDDKGEKAGKTDKADKVAEGEAAPEDTPKADVADTASKDEGAGAAHGAPPPMPVGPRPIEFESIRAKVGLLALLRGAKAGALAATFAGGSLEAELDNDGENYHLTGNWDAVDLRQLAFLRRKIDLPIAGTLNGDVDVSVPMGDEGKAKLTNAVGHLALKIADASIGAGTIATFEVPVTRIASIDGKLVLDKKKATIEHFDITGKDVEGELTGHIELKDSFARFGPRLHLRFKLGDEFLEAHKDLKILLTSMPRVKNATSPDGFIGFMVNNTLVDPKVTWRKDSPYKGAGGGATSAVAGDARKKDRAGKDKKGAKPPKASVGTGTSTGTTVSVPPKSLGGMPTSVAPTPFVTAPVSEAVAGPEPEVPVVAPEPVEEPATEAVPEPVPEPEAPAAPETAEAPTEGGENPEAPTEHVGEAPPEE